MLAIKGNFDGKRIILEETPALASCPVIVVFENDAGMAKSERMAWMKAQEASLAEVWDNAEDSDYDRM
ncbi:MAG TPA: hypothetical protein PKE55_05080 [Kiritimatiellia bacterium]|nr:hypothetical protein [Kiritimatiellia bacterium]